MNNIVDLNIIIIKTTKTTTSVIIVTCITARDSSRDIKRYQSNFEYEIITNRYRYLQISRCPFVRSFLVLCLL